MGCISKSISSLGSRGSLAQRVATGWLYLKFDLRLFHEVKYVLYRFVDVSITPD